MPRNPTKLTKLTDDSTLGNESSTIKEEIIKPSVATEEERKEAESIEPAVYVVTQPCKFVSSMGVLFLKEGKEVDERFYNIKDMMNQGIPLRLIRGGST